MKKPRPELKAWRDLTPEAQERFLTTFNPTNHPADFDAPGISFYADGSCYRDADLLKEVFFIERGRPKPLPLYPSPCCGLETAWVNDYRRACPCGKEHRF